MNITELEFWNQINKDLRKIILFPLSVRDSKTSNQLLDIFSKLTKVNDISIIIKNIKNLNTLFNYGATIFSETTQFIFQNIKSDKSFHVFNLFIRTSDEKCWGDIIDLIFRFIQEDVKNSLNAVMGVNISSFPAALLSLLSIFKAGIPLRTSLSESEFLSYFAKIKIILIFLLRNEKLYKDLITHEKTSLHRFLLTLSTVEFTDEFISLIWDSTTLKIIEILFSHKNNRELLIEIKSLNIIKNILTHLKETPHSQTNHLIHIFKILEYILCSYSANIIYTNFVEADGYKIFTNFLLIDENDSKNDLSILKTTIIEFLIKLSTTQNALETDFVIIPRNLDSDISITNINPLNFLALFYFKSQYDNLNDLIIEKIIDLIKFNVNNYYIMSQNYIIECFIENSLLKYDKNQELVCMLIHLILKNSSISIKELDSCTKLFESTNLKYSLNILTIFSMFSDDKNFISKFIESKCIKFIYRLYDLYFQEINETALIILNKILSGIIKYSNSKTIISKQNSEFFVVLNIAIDSTITNPIVFDLISLFLNDQNTYVLTFLFEKLYQLKDNNPIIRYNILKLLNTTFKDNISCIDSFVKDGGILLVLNQIVKQQNLLQFKNDCFDENVIYEIKIIFNALGLFHSMIKHDKQQNITSNLVSSTDIEDLFNSIKYLGCFDFVSNKNAIQQKIITSSAILKKLFEMCFDDISLYDDSFSPEYDIIINIPDHCIFSPLILKLIIFLCSEYFKNYSDFIENSQYTKLLELTLQNIDTIFSNSKSVYRIIQQGVMDLILNKLLSLVVLDGPVSYVNKILFRIISHGYGEKVFYHFITKFQTSFSFLAISYFLKYKGKSLLFYEINNQRQIHNDVFEYYITPKITSHSVYDTDEVFKKTDSNASLSETPVEENLYQFQDDLRDLIEISDPPMKAIQERCSENLDLETVDLENFKFLESITANSEKWKVLNDHLQKISAYNIQTQTSSNIEETSQVISIDNFINKSSTLFQDCNFIKIQEFIYNSYIYHLKLPYSQCPQNSFFQMNSNDNSFSYIHLPFTFKTSMFQHSKYAFDKNIFAGNNKNGCSFSIWFKYDELNHDKRDDCPIVLLCLTERLFQNEEIQEKNILTLAFYPLWQLFIISTDLLDLKSFDLMDHARNNKNLFILNLDIQENNWHHIVCTLTPTQMINGRCIITLYVNKIKQKQYNATFKNLSTSNEFIDAYIGSFPKNTFLFNRQYQLGSFSIFPYLISTEIIETLNIFGPEGIFSKNPPFYYEKIKYLRTSVSFLLNLKKFIHVSPHNMQLKSTYNISDNDFKTLYLNKYSKLTNNTLIPLRNSYYFPSLENNNLWNSIPFCFARLTNLENFSLCYRNEFERSLFKTGGVNIFLILIQHCQNSENLYHHINCLLKFISFEYISISKFIPLQIFNVLSIFLKIKKDIIDDRIAHAFISFISSTLVFDKLPNEVIKSIIFDLEFWLSTNEKIYMNILEYILNDLFENNTTLTTFINNEFIDEYFIDSFLVCILRYPVSNKVLKFYDKIIIKLFIYCFTTKSFIKLYLFIVNSLINQPMDEIQNDETKSVFFTCKHISKLILQQTLQYLMEDNKLYKFLFDNVIGIHFLIILLNKDIDQEISTIVWNIFSSRISDLIQARTEEQNKFNDTQILTNFYELSKIYSKISHHSTSPGFQSICFYISQSLAESQISFETCLNYLFNLLTDGKITDPEKFDLNELLEYLKKFPVDKIRKYSSNIFYDHSSEDHLYPSFYFFPEMVITIINFLSKRLEYECIQIQNNTESLEKINLCILDILKMIYFSLLSKTSLILVCCTFNFIIGPLRILKILETCQILKEKTKHYNSIYEICIKVCAIILERSFYTPSIFEISENWKEPKTAFDYPQMMLYLLINENNDQILKNVVMSIMKYLFINFLSQSSLINEMINLDIQHLLTISSFILGQVVCFGSNFDETIFTSILTITQSTYLNKEEPSIFISRYFESVNTYLTIILLTDLDPKSMYNSIYYHIFTLLSVNSHIFFNQINSHYCTLKNIIFIFFSFILWIVLKPLPIESNDYFIQNESLTLLRSIYDIIILQHFEIFRSMFEEFEDILSHKNIYQIFDESLYNQVTFFETFINFFPDKNELENLIDNKLKQIKLKYQNEGEFSNLFQENYLKNTLWFNDFNEALKFQSKSIVSSYYNDQNIKIFFSLQSLKEINESIFHENNMTKNESGDLRRLESLTCSGYFGVIQRFRFNDEFYFNYKARLSTNIHDKQPSSTYCQSFQEFLRTNISLLSNTQFKDMIPLLSFINRPLSINPVSLLRHYLNKREVLDVFRVARVNKLDAIEGLAFLLDKGLLIIEGLGLNGKNNIIEISQNLSDGIYFDDINTLKISFNEKSFHKFLPYKNILCIRKRRYCLMSIALEIFDYDNYSIFLVFKKSDRNLFLTRLTRFIKNNKNFSDFKKDKNILYSYFEPVISLLVNHKIQKVQQKWVNREIDNFTYLLYLNIRAGRSFNDLSQYPIFPWTIADYDSPIIDLENEKTYRNLSMPMGGQTKERLNNFITRYNEWDPASENMPKFFYSTFYSTSMNTSSLLVRSEPFSSIFIELQGKQFDLPDRIFQSIKSLWISSSKTSSSDFKELIPEFYYLTDFLKNTNKFIFGTKQNGTIVDDVVLPPWAKNDPRNFIRINRAALESEYVSSQINNWIDLIFGYKQTGKNAIKNFNLFYSWFYKGSVNLHNISDPVVKNSLTSFIMNFGQVPKKLFIYPHPKRKIKMHSIPDTLLHFSDPPRVTIHSNSYSLPIMNIKGHILTQISVSHPSQILIPPNFTMCLSWERTNGDLVVLDEQKNISHIIESYYHGQICIGRFLSIHYLAFGYDNGKISIWKYKLYPRFQIKFYKFLFGHQSEITSINASSHQKFLITGSKDGVVIQWDLIDMTYLRQLCEEPNPVVSISISKFTSEIAVFYTFKILIFTVQGEKLLEQSVTDKIYIGVTLNNKLHEISQIIVIANSKGIELWSFGYQTIKKTYTFKDIDDYWVEFTQVKQAFIDTNDQLSMKMYKKIYFLESSENQENITAISFNS